MNKKQYLKYHAQCCKKMVEITRRKNADYTGVGADPFSNFDRVSLLGITETERGFLVRMLDKFCRMVSFVQRGTLLVKDESLEDTCLDLANYCILFAGYVRSRREKKK